jgi:NAD(P)H-dependent flavin oxidoreductase YrpB (nitropropane dioxygenase family)
MLSTRFTDLVGCTIPLQQAGMGAASPPEPAAAVSNAGGLGMLGTARPGGGTLAGIAGLLDRLGQLTTRPVGVNFIVRDTTALDPAWVALAASRARVVEFFLWAPLDPRLSDVVHQHGALVACQVGSREDAVAAVARGCDLIVAQSIEAGGHVRGRIGLLALLSEVLAAVGVPVLAAGGIGDGRAMAAALAAGADGVRMGTRFLAAEAGLHPQYVAALLGARAEDTVNTEAFSVGWPAPHRVLRSCLTAAKAFTAEVVGERASLDGTRVPVVHWAPAVADRTTTGTIEAMALYAGESVGAVQRVQPAGDIVRDVTEEAERLLRRWS